MKENEAPKTIYFNPLLMEDGESIVRRCTFERQSDSQIEYTRTDAFIEKVINFLNYKLDDIVVIQNPDSIIPQHIVKPELIEDFKKYIEEYNV